MNLIKKCTTFLLALLLVSPIALFTACGDEETPDNGGNTDTEQGGGNTDDENGDTNPDDGTTDGGNSGTTPDDGGNSGTTPDDGGNNDGNEGTTPDTSRISAPALTLTDNVARWDAVENAAHYVYKIGANGDEYTTDGTYCVLHDGQALFVKAVSATNTLADSEWSSVTYTYTDPYVAPPAWDRRPTYNTDMSGSGGEWDRYECSEGYYQIQLVAGQESYYSFRVSQTGQYALITNQAKNGLQIERCDASSHYIAPVTHPAQVMDNGTLYSYVSCTESYATSLADWRATFKISCPTNASNFVIRFVRVGEPVAEPERNVEDISANDIKFTRPIEDNPETEAIETEYTTFMKAPDMPSYVTKEVPWLASETPTYFFDEDYEMTFTITNELGQTETVTKTGFYRYGEESDENAPVIWAALTSSASRLFTASFDTVQYTGNNLLLFYKQDVDGNYHLKNYVDFIMNNGGEVDNTNNGFPMAGDETMVCYANAVNTDGMYPVNQELFAFLNHYTRIMPPVLADGVEVNKNDYWLAPCYYYERSVAGSQNNPIQLQTGENTISVLADQQLYYSLTATEETTFTVSCTNGNAYLYIPSTDARYEQSFSFTITVAANSSVLLEFSSYDFSEDSFVVTVA